jgi:FAD/FMN-containing dehydrogenase
VPHDRVLRAIAAELGAAGVVTDRDRVASHTTDWTGRFTGEAAALVRPSSTEEVAAVLARCHEAGVAVVPQGGNTGLVGGGVPRHGEIVLHLGRLRGVEPVDEGALQVTVSAGEPLAGLQAAAADAGLAYAVDLAARDTATVGGTIATNAGGLHVLRWGGTRQQLMGIEAVLADGRVVSHLGGLVKDNTGYDLAGLLCGSEGTLAVVTRARLRLVPRHEARVVAMVGFVDVAAAVGAVARWRRRVASLTAVEVVLAAGVDLVCEVGGLPPPLASRPPVLVLVEAADRDDPTAAVASAVEATDGVLDVAVATNEREAAALWRYREDHTLAINTLGPPHKLDVTLPMAALARFAAEVPDAVTAVEPGARTWLFGHLGDGNLHVNVTDLAPDDDRVDDVVLRLVASLGGSISAEHGIGRAKRRWLDLVRSPAEIDAMRAIKHALDPRGILNPGVLVPERTA